MKFPSLFKPCLFIVFLLTASCLTAFSQNDQLFYGSLSQYQKESGVGLQAKYPSSNAAWVDYKNAPGAYSVKLPHQPKQLVNDVADPAFPDRPVKIFLAGAGDSISLTSYLVKYNDLPIGQYMGNSSVALDEIVKQFETKGEFLGQVRKIWKDGYEGREFEMVLQETYVEVKTFYRGNRNYLLMRQNLDSDEEPANDQFFTSFRFEDYQMPSQIAVTLGNVKMMMPSESAPFSQEAEIFFEKMVSNHAANPNSGAIYCLETAKLSKYLKFPNVDSLYNYIDELLNEETDSVIKTHDEMIGKIKGRVTIKKDLANGSYTQSRLWVDGDQFFYQFAIVEKSELQSKQLTNFFENLTYQPSTQKFDLSASKAHLLAEDVLAKDTAIASKAYATLDVYNFEKRDLPIIYKILRKPLPNDTAEKSVRFKLINQLIDVHDATTVPFLKDLYQTKNVDVIKAKVLATIPLVDSTAYDWYLKSLIEQPAFQLQSYWNLFRPLSDSLPYVAKNLNQILNLIDRKQYSRHVLDLVAQLITADEKVQFLPFIIPHEKRITANAIADVDDYINNQREIPNKAFSYLTILEEFKSPLLNEFSNKVFKIDSSAYLHTLALASRIRAKLPLDQRLLDAHLDSLYSRYLIMKAYFDAGRLDEVPGKYKDPEAFARLLVHQSVDEQGYTLKTATLLGIVTTAKGNYYAFEVITDDDDQKYLMVCGAFDAKQATFKLDTYEAFSDWDEVAPDWRQQAKQMVESIEKYK